MSLETLFNVDPGLFLRVLVLTVVPTVLLVGVTWWLESLPGSEDEEVPA